MKTKFILGSLALAATVVGCSNEEFDTIAVENQSNMIELSENFMIGTIGEEGPESRTHWVYANKAFSNVYSPIVGGEGTNNVIAQTSVVAPTIGLCWIGQSLGQNVYTNYEFIHNGWLGKDQTAAIFDTCDDNILTNGWLYSDFTAVSSTEEGTEAVQLNEDGKTVNATAADKKVGNTTLKVADANLNSGVYKTENKAIFGGQYIAYYPYNPDFVNAGTIPAKSKVEFTNVPIGDATYFEMAENTFRFTNVAEINGGAKAQGFGFKNLSGVVRVVLKSKTTSMLDVTVDQVLLYSKNSDFKKEVRLSASAIAAGKNGIDLYTETVETSKSILINLAEGINPIKSNAAAEEVDAAAIYVTALPSKVSDLVVLAHSADGKWAEYNVGEFEIAAGTGKQITASFAAEDFKKVYYAVDQTTLNSALASAKNVATATSPATVKVLGDIRLTQDVAVEDNVIVEGDDIYVPEGVVLQLWNATMKSNIIVEGQTCCGTARSAGQLNVLNSTIDGDVTIEKGYTGKNAGSVYFMPGNNNVTKNSTIIANGNIYVAAANITPETIVNFAGKLENNATITIYEEGVINTKGADIENNGTIEVIGEFNVLDASGATVAAAGENMTNNGTFIDNVGAKVGGATQYMINNGDYICKVHSQARLDEAYTNKLACNIIEFVNDSGVDYDFTSVAKHNNKDVDLVVNAVVGFATTVDATLGNVTINEGKSLYIHKSKLIKDTNYAEITINGDLNSSGAIYVREDVRNLKAKNFTTLKNGSVTFENRKEYNGKTMVVSGAIEVKVGGTFTINAKTANKNIALVTCTKLVEGGTFNGKPEVVK